MLLYSAAGMATNENPHSHAGAPLSYDQWQMDDGRLSAACPPGWQCDAALLNDGFMQRSLTGVDGHKYMQTVVAEGLSVGLQAPADLAYVSETFVSLGHGGHRLSGVEGASTGKDWDRISGIAYKQRMQEIEAKDASRFYTETRGTSGLLLDPSEELFITQSLESTLVTDSGAIEKFDMDFMFQRGWFDDDCCGKSAATSARHELAAGHDKAHKQGKGHGAKEKKGPGTGGHSGEIINFSQSMSTEDFSEEYRYEVHPHKDDEGKLETIASRLDIAVELLLVEDGELVGESYYLLEKRTGDYQLTENSDYDPFATGDVSLSWTTDNGIKHISQGMVLSSVDVDLVSGYESLQILDPFDDTVIDEESSSSLLETGPWIDQQQIIVDPFI